MDFLSVAPTAQKCLSDGMGPDSFQPPAFLPLSGNIIIIIIIILFRFINVPDILPTCGISEAVRGGQDHVLCDQGASAPVKVKPLFSFALVFRHLFKLGLFV